MGAGGTGYGSVVGKGGGVKDGIMVGGGVCGIKVGTLPGVSVGCTVTVATGGAVGVVFG